MPEERGRVRRKQVPAVVSGPKPTGDGLSQRVLYTEIGQSGNKLKPLVNALEIRDKNKIATTATDHGGPAYFEPHRPFANGDVSKAMVHQ